jgi:hypothetical protein
MRFSGIGFIQEHLEDRVKDDGAGYCSTMESLTEQKNGVKVTGCETYEK